MTGSQGCDGPNDDQGKKAKSAGGGRRQRVDLRLLVRVLTPMFIVALGVGAVFDHQRSTRRTEERFSEKQAFMAQQAAERFSEVFEEVDKLLVLLGHIPGVIRADASGGHMLATVVAQLQDHGGVMAARINGQKQVTLTAGSSLAEAQRLLGKVAACVEPQGICVRGPVRMKIGKAKWVMVVTLPMPLGKKGAVMVGLDWDALRTDIARMATFHQTAYTWILDHRGRLVMHPEHRDQLGKPAVKRTKACSKCHSSFALHQEMLSGRMGTGRIQVAASPPKLVAFTPFAVGLKQWSLAVATPARVVSAAARRDLMATVLFTGAIMLVMAAGALLLDRETSRRMRSVAEFNHKLEHEVRRRTDELGTVYQRLAELQTHHTRLERVAVAGEMASIVAHEIRTPLNALSINAQMITRLLRRTDDKSRQRVKEVLGTLESEIGRINQLVEENLLAHVRRRSADLKALDLNEVLMDAVRFMEPEARRTGVELHFEAQPDLPLARADEPKLRQVLLNIILNAVQAMPDGGEVTLSAATDEDRLVVRIEDNGPGIEGVDPDTLHEVFRPFVTTKEDGTGLGLAICARLVKDMGGTIEVQSRSGEGACFTISLPLDEEE